MVGIYKITNLINNKAYIGQSINIESRWRHHKADSKNKLSENYEKILYRAFRKYGIKNFSFEVIEQCSIDELDIKEKYWINYYDTFFNGYNSTKGSREEEFKIKQHKKSFLTQEKVNEIKKILKNNTTLSTEEIGKKFNVSGRTVRDINTGSSWFDQNEKYPIRKPYASLTNNYNKLGEKNYCIDCGIEISQGGTRCIKCSHQLQKRAVRPNREELKELIRTKTFTQIGKNFGVTDSAIKKWCDSMNLPRTKKEIKSYSDEQWLNI